MAGSIARSRPCGKMPRRIFMSESHAQSSTHLAEPLSADGVQRQRMMLEELLDAMQGVHRRRRIRRRAAGAALFLLLTALTTWMLGHFSTRSAPRIAGNNRPSIDPAAPAQIASRFEIVQTDPTIADRLHT